MEEKRIKAQTASSHKSDGENFRAEHAFEKNGRLKMKVRKKADIKQ